jgi:metallophosphoesterase superfamily enzyme
MASNDLDANKTDTLNHGNTSVEKSDSVEKRHPPVIDTDKAIIVSDLHLGYEKCNLSAITDFLTDHISKGNSKEYSLFIIGDLWDLWRKHDIIYSQESDEVLSLISTVY